MKRTITTLAIVSGKGGVGKSVVAVNLAETLAAEGHRVALVDVDFGQGACAVLLNESPTASVADLVQRTARPDAVRHQTATGLTLVQAVADPARMPQREAQLYAALDALLTDLKRDHTFVLLDTPAGIDGPVRWALDRADLGALVLAGEPTAIADAYRLAKLVWQADPAYPFGAIVNFADTEAEARSVAERFSHVTRHFTGRAPDYLGWIPFASSVRRSVMNQEPAVRTPGPVFNTFQKLARTIVTGQQEPAEPTAA